MTVKLLTEHHLEFLSLKVGCTGSSESIHVKNATLLEITCHSSTMLSHHILESMSVLLKCHNYKQLTYTLHGKGKDTKHLSRDM